jgi:hypothetical protein
MIFKRARKSKKAQTVKVVVMLVVGLVVVGMLLYLGYKYILGTGESVGQLGSCQGQGGTCMTKDACEQDTTKQAFFGMGCGKDANDPKKYCCIPKERTS